MRTDCKIDGFFFYTSHSCEMDSVTKGNHVIESAEWDEFSVPQKPEIALLTHPADLAVALPCVGAF